MILLSQGLKIKEIEIRGTIMACKECYSENKRATPLLGPQDCLENHLQYVCGTCGRCICIDKDKKRGLQRWNFPFKSLAIAKLYLRTADFTNKTACGIYEIENAKGRISYKIFVSDDDLSKYLNKNKDKKCLGNKAIFKENKYQNYPDTQVKNLTEQEIENYLAKMKSRKERL